MCGQPGFVDGQRIRFAAVPIIGVAAHRDYQLAGWNFSTGVRESISEPVVGRDWAGFTALIVLIVIHHKDGVRGGGEAGQVPVGVLCRSGQAQLQPCLLKAAMIAREHRQIVRHAGGGQAFHIEHHPVPAALPRLYDDILGERIGPRRIGQQRGHIGSGKLIVFHILDHQQHDRPMQCGAQLAMEPCVGIDRHRVIAGVDQSIGGDHPVQIIEVLMQRCRTFFIPRDIKSDPQRQCAGIGGCQMRQLVANARDMAEEWHSLFALAVKRQRRRRGNLNQRGGKYHCGKHDQREQRKTQPSDQTAATTRAVKENRRYHANTPARPRLAPRLGPRFLLAHERLPDSLCALG